MEQKMYKLIKICNVRCKIDINYTSVEVGLFTVYEFSFSASFLSSDTEFQLL